MSYTSIQAQRRLKIDQLSGPFNLTDRIRKWPFQILEISVLENGQVCGKLCQILQSTEFLFAISSHFLGILQKLHDVMIFCPKLVLKFCASWFCPAPDSVLLFSDNILEFICIFTSLFSIFRNPQMLQVLHALHPPGSQIPMLCIISRRKCLVYTAFQQINSALKCLMFCILSYNFCFMCTMHMHGHCTQWFNKLWNNQLAGILIMR